jgi:hypothetical protein
MRDEMIDLSVIDRGRLYWIDFITFPHSHSKRMYLQQRLCIENICLSQKTYMYQWLSLTRSIVP